MADFGGGGFVPPNPGVDAELLARAKLDEMKQHRGPDGHRPPRPPRGPRFGLLRRMVRFIRGGGD